MTFDYRLRGGPFGAVADRLFGRRYLDRVMASNAERLRAILE